MVNREPTGDELNGVKQDTVQWDAKAHRVTQVNSDGDELGVQNPLPTDGDSVYCKDLDIPNSDIGTFTGDICGLFNDYHTEFVDTSTNNPKTFTIHLKRPLTSNKIGIGSLTGNFSNVKIFLKDLAGTVRQFVDDSANDAKLTSNLYEFTTNTFIEAVFEFYTTDAVKISGLFIPKSISRTITSIDGIVSAKNSSQISLLSGGIFIGLQEDTKNYGMIQAALFADVSGTFEIQFRSTPTSTWRTGDTYIVDAGDDKVWSFQAARRFMRIVYTNDSTNQTSFDMQTILKPVYVKPSSHPIGGVIKTNDDAELVKAQITGERPDGDYGNVAVTNGNNLKTSLEEFDPALYTTPLPVADFLLLVSKGLIPGHSLVNKFGQNEEIGTGAFEDIWDVGGTYPYPADGTAPITHIGSDDAGDTELIEIEGLDIDGNLVIQTKTLTGITHVLLDTPLWRIFRMRNIGTTDIIGKVHATDTGDTTIYAQIDDGNNQTLMALYTIPAGKTGYLYQGTASIAGVLRAYSIAGKFFIREFGSVFQLKNTFGLATDGTGEIVIPYPSRLPIPEKADMRVRGISSALNGVMNATFTILLVDN